MNSAPSPTAENSTDQAAFNDLLDKLVSLAETAPSHRLMLAALITTYTAIAITHPCCTRSAAETALREGGRLLVNSVDGAPTNTPLH